jgi:6-phosphogluconolactonase
VTRVAGGGAGRGRRDAGPEVVVAPTSADAAKVAASRIGAALIAAVEARGVAHWVTTGGSTPGAIYAQLAELPYRETVPWDRVHLWWGDERWVPPVNILSNALACWTILLDEVPVPRDQVHVVPVGEAMAAGEGPEAVANRYAEMLAGAGLELDPAGFPRLDVVLVGVGTDGHLFSVFPGSATWDDPRWVQAVAAPRHIAPHIERVTLHPRIVTAARMPVAVVFGAAKAAILGEIFGAAPDERRLPAQLALREGALWVLDAAAAAGLGNRADVGSRSRPRDP